MKIGSNVLLCVWLLQMSVFTAFGQQAPCDKTLLESLQQTAEVLNRPESKALWGVALNAPVLIVDPSDNKMYVTAIEDGAVEPLREEPWDQKVPLANSFFEYDGKRYATIIREALMRASCEQRVNLLSHEIFHMYQQGLGIENASSHNYHMDQAEGRALLRIEMEALRHVLDGDRTGLAEALGVRAYRQSLFPDNNEDLYELNEGLAEYTGVKMSAADVREYVKNRLEYDISRGYTNAFGYFTGSAYAVVLDDLYPQWRYDGDLSKGLIRLIKKADPRYAAVMGEADLKKLLAKYDYAGMLAEEHKELESFGDIAQFRELLVPGAPKLSLPNRKINFTYNPNDRVISLGNAVLLRNMTLTGEWGRINVKSGIVRMNDWSAFYLLPPTNIARQVVRGDDYEITIHPGWHVAEENGVYGMVKE